MLAETSAVAGLPANPSQPLYIVWKPEYNLGAPILDEQHRGVVSTINSLHHAMSHDTGKSVLRPIIGMVKDYTDIHFRVEEAFLAEFRYPGYGPHQELHNELRQELDKVGHDSLWHGDPYEFMQFLRTWWLTHICVQDRLYLGHLLAARPQASSR